MTRTLLVIDVQNDYFPGGELPLWQPEATEARIVDAIGAAQARGDKVVLVQHVSPETEGLFATGSTGAAIRPAILAAAGNAPVVVKTHADAFQETDLKTHLGDTTELLICGMMTQNCVIFTALSELAEGLTIKVIGDLCAAPSEIVHLIALNGLESKGYVVGPEIITGAAAA